MQLDQKASTNPIELHLISAFFVISKAIFHCIPFFESCDDILSLYSGYLSEYFIQRVSLYEEGDSKSALNKMDDPGYANGFFAPIR